MEASLTRQRKNGDKRNRANDAEVNLKSRGTLEDFRLTEVSGNVVKGMLA